MKIGQATLDKAGSGSASALLQDAPGNLRESLSGALLKIPVAYRAEIQVL